MSAQEESNNLALLPKTDQSVNSKESNTLINAYDLRKLQDRRKAFTSKWFK